MTGNKSNRPSLRVALQIATAAIAVAQPLHAFAQTVPVTQVDVQPQPLSNALTQIARQTGVEIIFAAGDVRGKRAPVVKGSYSTEQALTIALRGSNLVFRRTPQGAYLVQSSSGQTERGLAGAGSTTAENEGADIVVTAQKREERLVDVPQSISVISTNTLEELGAAQFRDWINTVPGLSATTSQGGQTQLNLRGVTVGVDISPTVGIYVDDVPYGSSTAFGTGAQNTFDMGLFDVDRVEVLRGPQGTLYGASTMGGLVKYVTKAPDVTRSTASLRGGVSDTHRGGLSFFGSAAINTPLADEKAALRVTGFYSRDGGFIDNTVGRKEDVNRSDLYGARADILLKPSEALSIRITGLLQNTERDGFGAVDYTFAGVPAGGSLRQNILLEEPFKQRFRLVSGTLSYDLDFAEFTSISSYQTSHTEFVLDASGLFVPAFASGAGGQSYQTDTKKFAQEVRLASSGTRTLDWIIGGFYTRETSRFAIDWVLRDSAGQSLPNPFFTFASPSRYEETSAFGDLTWHITEKFDVTGGVRYAKNRLTNRTEGSGLFAPAPNQSTSKDDVFTWLANARYKFNDSTTAYIRYATGYRPGGPNFDIRDIATGLPLGPATFQADTLKSYEAGFRAATPNRRFGIDLAAYWIDWNNIQVATNRGGFSFVVNSPGGARIRGAELTLTARPVSSFTMTAAFAYQNAKLREAEPDLRASAGERLPNVPRFTAVLNADYKLSPAGLQPSIGATFRHTGARNAGFGIAPPQYNLPGYSTVDLRGGISVNQIDVQLYVRNLFDKRGQAAAFVDTGFPRITVLQPRTIGISASTSF